MPDSEFTQAAMKRIIHRNTDRQVSADAAEELGEILELFAGDISEEAIAQAREDGRKTVRREDVQAALE